MTNQIKPAGFLIRILAYFIDIILFVPFIALGIYAFKTANFALYLCSQIPFLIYKPVLESKLGVTFGKHICKIEVMSTDGQRISISDSYVRFFPFLLYILAQIMLSYQLFGNYYFAEATTLAEKSSIMRTHPMNSIKSILSIILFIDCILIAFRKDKKALHDSLAKTVCIYRGTKSVHNQQMISN